MLIVVIIALIILAFAAFVYFQDDSDFTKLTKYSFIDMMFDKKTRTLSNVYKALQNVNGTSRVLLNVHVQEGRNVYTIPAILLHESGIHIISLEQKDGWIIGSDRMLEWMNVLYKNKKVMFENPVLMNKRFVYAIREAIPEVSEQAFQSVVVFNNGCAFQKVEISSLHVDVMKEKELGAWANSLAGEHLSADDIETIYRALESKMVFSKKAMLKQTKKNEVNVI